ncbi:rod shape-determining protein MreC [Lutibacter oricola]|uniref:Cell shape-determining protein MreC n=1 Tax=Lutibacter oricola TaxID=762486 RepID=A0A1H3BEW5_9FLAO|nr:rod shape-determining protein MreC [Lutibacter oricola]SDX40436.1 rod shape-determining protein MreC [Lutibacter oricola]
MQQIIYFIRKFRFFLLFILLETVALFFTIQHHSYHSSKFVNSANNLTGGIYSQAISIGEFFNLKSENKRLIDENTHLKNILEQRKLDSSSEFKTQIDTLNYYQKYNYVFAKIINNSYSKPNNYLTINKGSKQQINTDLGVINSKGVIGVVKNVSSNFATVLSILNSNSKINVKLKNSSHFGTMTWNGEETNVIQLIDIPRQAVVKEGDTIITGGKSAIFPEGILVGTIKNVNFENNQYKQIDIQLFNDMTSIGYVQIIKNLQREEQLNLENTTENE